MFSKTAHPRSSHPTREEAHTSRGLRWLLPSLFLPVVIGCASTNGKKILLTSIAASVGGTLGALSAPVGEKPLGHAALWGGITGSIAGATSHFIWNDELRAKRSEMRVSELSSELDALRESQRPKLIYSTKKEFSKDLPDGYRGLIQRGEWRIYSADHWVEDGETRIIHQDKIVELIPPRLTPHALSKKSAQNQKGASR